MHHAHVYARIVRVERARLRVPGSEKEEASFEMIKFTFLLFVFLYYTFTKAENQQILRYGNENYME